MSGIVSVIVLNFNGAAILARCLDHLLAQTRAPDEILVVDNASADGSDAILARYGARGVRALFSARNLGCAGGRNFGVQAARGDIIAFMDNDGYADPRWLEEALAVLDDDGVGAVAPLVFFDRQPLVLNGAGGTLNRRGYGGDHCFQEPFEFAHLPDRVLYPMGCGMVVRRRVLEAMGGFDEALFNYYDDVEVGVWSWRLGLRVVCAAAAWVDHGFGSSDTINRNKIALCERNRLRTVLKFFPPHLLPGWILRELASLLWPRAAAAWAVPWRAWGDTLANLPSALRLRRRFGPRRGQFDGLLYPSWGSFPPPRPTNHLTQPSAACATATVVFDEPTTPPQLSYGWYQPERDGATTMRWSAAAAAVFVRASAPTTHLDCQWRAARADQETTIRLRRPDDLGIVWQHSVMPGVNWTGQRLACEVPAGLYELQMISTPTAGVAGGRALGIGVARLALV